MKARKKRAAQIRACLDKYVNGDFKEKDQEQ
uniref:Uncharacterized protein n=1 Tax=Rhizophora mucronata TaxID=61149 RepID=A0A2P2NH99_RHIMU